MPPSPEQPDEQNFPLSLQRAADQHVNQILDRLQAARESRNAALALHPERLTLKTQLIRGMVPEDAAAQAAAPAPASTVQTAGYLLAIGDSWFDYPIRDVLTNLDDHFGYNIESAAHKGDAIETMVSHVGQLDKFARNLDKIISLGVTPKAVLLSGGGNDIAGTHFDLFLNNIDLKLDALNEQVVAAVIDIRLATAYRLMFLSINGLCQARLGHTVPILIHGYDHPVPDGRGFLGGWGPLPGPWLKPGFDQKLYPNLPDNIALMTTLIDRFNTMLQSVAQEPGAGTVRYVDVRGTLSNAPANYEQFWANELHPTGGDPLDPGSNGFLLVAQRFAAVLAQLP
jgi:hypothetical protein